MKAGPKNTGPGSWTPAIAEHMSKRSYVQLKDHLLAEASVAALAETFKVLGDATRVRILDALARGRGPRLRSRPAARADPVRRSSTQLRLAAPHAAREVAAAPASTSTTTSPDEGSPHRRPLRAGARARCWSAPSCATADPRAARPSHGIAAARHAHDARRRPSWAAAGAGAHRHVRGWHDHHLHRLRAAC